MFEIFLNKSIKIFFFKNCRPKRSISEALETVPESCFIQNISNVQNHCAQSKVDRTSDTDDDDNDENEEDENLNLIESLSFVVKFCCR